jgi:hypothetical protein
MAPAGAALQIRLVGVYRVHERGTWTAYRARILSIGGDVPRAIDELSNALVRGVDGWPWWHASAQRDLAPMAQDTRYQRLVEPK